MSANGGPRRRLLVLGLGSYAFGRERRALTMLGQMEHTRPYFMIPKWGDGSVRQALSSAGFEYVEVGLGYLGRAHPWWTIVTLWHAPAANLAILRSLTRWSCGSIVVLHLHVLLTCLPALLMARSRSLPVTFYLGDTPGVSWVHRAFGWAMRLLGSEVVANSRAVAKGVERLGVDVDRVHVVHNGVDSDRFSADDRPGAVSSDGGIVVGFFGQLAEAKGVYDLVEVARLLEERAVDARFVLFGRPDTDDTSGAHVLRKQIHDAQLADRVILGGWVEDVAEAYGRVDVVLVPSRFADSAPNVVIEAQAMGRPVIGTRMGGIPELLDDTSGVLVESGDVDGMARAIASLASDPVARAAMARAALDRARRDFDASFNSRRVEAILS